MQLEMQYGTKGNNCMPSEWEMFRRVVGMPGTVFVQRQQQIPFGNDSKRGNDNGGGVADD